MPLPDTYEKKECIHGIIYDMSPSASYEHSNVNGNVYGEIHAQLKGSLCKVYMENADLYMDTENKEYVIPDIMVVCDTRSFKKGTSKYYGTPKFVMETLSPSTAHKDRTEKMDFYGRKGVPEYWIVDYRSKSIEIYYLEEERYHLVNTIMLSEDPEEAGCSDDIELSLRALPHVKLHVMDIFSDIHI